ncbi:hypothetical protein [Rossellomorea sp. FM04394]|uniref:hypothetical protein n=1 Tax=Rossellomorea sp. FM04394 TaxID=3243076 RepID=UPI0035A6796E
MKDDLAHKRWMTKPAHIREKFEGNVYCRACGVTTIVDYSVDSDNHNIVLKGSCKTCGGKVARVIES